VKVNVERDTTASSQRVDLANDSLVLRGVTSSTALEGLVTRVGRGTTSQLPLERPVAVDITANTGASRDSLSVLAPETVGGLGVDEAYNRESVQLQCTWLHEKLTIRVDNGGDVKVVLVDESLDSRVGAVLGQQLVGHVLGSLKQTMSAMQHQQKQFYPTMVAIHSRAWTVPWKTTAGLEPLPPLPQMWIPVRARPWKEFPRVKTSERLG
jgi:hypothetical protein